VFRALDFFNESKVGIPRQTFVSRKKYQAWGFEKVVKNILKHCK
jgi:hypothetical protein